METAQESKLPKIALFVLISLIIVLVGFNLTLSRYGAFWQKPQPGISSPSPEPSKQVEFTIGCPVPQEYCQSGKEVYWEGELIGLEFILPKGTPLLAAFTGEPKQGRGIWEDGTKLKVISLTAQGGYRALYFFQGEAETLPFALRKGEVLARVRDEPISATKGVNFYFSVEKNGETLPISSRSFQ